MSVVRAARPAKWPSTLLILLALATVTLLSSLALDLLLLPGDGGLGRDFSAFYAAGLALRHGLDPYSWTQLGGVESRLHSIGDPRHLLGFNPYANPPIFALVMAAFTRLSDRQAYLLWTAAMIAAMVGGAVIVMRSYGVRGRGWAALLFVLTPAPVICLFLGQQTPLLLLGLAASLAALRSDRPALAGAMLTVGWVKPHLLFPLVVVMAATLAWHPARRLLAGFLGTGLLLGLVSWLTTGAGSFVSWARDLVSYGHTLDAIQPDLSSLAGLYLSVLGRPWSTLIMAATVVLWLLFAGLLVRRSRQEGLTPADDAWLRLVSIALAAWLLATPYTHPADLVLLAVALPVLLGSRLQHLGLPAVRLALTALLVAPEADLLGFRPNFVLSYSVLVPLAFLVALAPWRALFAHDVADAS